MKVASGKYVVNSFNHAEFEKAAFWSEQKEYIVHLVLLCGPIFIIVTFPV